MEQNNDSTSQTLEKSWSASEQEPETITDEEKRASHIKPLQIVTSRFTQLLSFYIQTFSFSTQR